MFKEDIVSTSAAKELGLASIAMEVREKEKPQDDFQYLISIFKKIKERYKPLEEKYNIQLPLGKDIILEAILGTTFDSLRWGLDSVHAQFYSSWEKSDIINYNKLTRSLTLAVQSYLHTKYRELADSMSKFMTAAGVPEELIAPVYVGSYPVNNLIPIVYEYNDSVLDEILFSGIIKRLVYSISEYVVEPLPGMLRSLKSH